MNEGVLRDSVGYQMKRVAHALRLRMDALLRKIGLTTPQYAALSVLEGEAGLSGAELARRGFVTPQTMNQILVNLETGGLVKRRPHPVHDRVLQAYVTEKGRRLLSEAHHLVEAIEERMLSSLNESQRLKLLNTLRTCAESLETAAETTVTPTK